MSAKIIPFHKRHRANHADRLALLAKASPARPPPASPTWIDFWIDATLAEFQYFNAAVLELTR